MKNILLLLFFLVFIQIQSIFAVSGTNTNNFIFNVKNTHNQIDTSIIDLEDYETRAEIKSIRTLSTIAIVLSAASLLTFGLSLIPAAIIGIIAFSKFRKYKEKLDSLDSDDDNYLFLKSTKRRVLLALLLSLIPFLFLVLALFVLTDGEFIDEGIKSMGLLAGITFILLEWFNFETNKTVDK